MLPPYIDLKREVPVKHGETETKVYVVSVACFLKLNAISTLIAVVIIASSICWCNLFNSLLNLLSVLSRQRCMLLVMNLFSSDRSNNKLDFQLFTSLGLCAAMRKFHFLQQVVMTEGLGLTLLLLSRLISCVKQLFSVFLSRCCSPYVKWLFV